MSIRSTNRPLTTEMILFWTLKSNLGGTQMSSNVFYLSKVIRSIGEVGAASGGHAIEFQVPMA
jgi:hypothetical protein